MGQVTFISIPRKVFEEPIKNEDREFLNNNVYALPTYRKEWLMLEIPIEHIERCHRIFGGKHARRKSKKGS